MKKNILAIVIAIVAMIGSFVANAETRWGITAGANFNKIHFKQSDIFKSDYAPGGNLGVTGELMMPGIGFGVDASVLYSMRNGKLHMGDKKVFSAVGLGTENVSLHYIDIPLNLKFRYHNLDGFENTLMPMAFVGPTISVLAGHNKVKDQLSYNKMSVSMQMGIGCELFNKVQVKMGYQFGIGETLHTKLLDEHSAKNRTWFMIFTYFIR